MSDRRLIGRWFAWAAGGVLVAAAGLIVGCWDRNPDEAMPLDITDSAPPIRADAALAKPAKDTGRPMRSGSASFISLTGSVGRAAPMSPVFNPAQQLIRLGGVRGEVVSFQMNFVGPAGGLSGLQLSMSDLQSPAKSAGGRPGRLDRQAIEMFRVLPIRVAGLPAWYQLYESAPGNRTFGDFPDAMVPIDHLQLGQPWNLKPGELLNIWADVPIPPGAEAGVYEGQLSVRSAGFAEQRITVRVEVLPLALPAEPALQILCPVEFKQMLSGELGKEELSDAFLYGPGDPQARRRLEQWIQLGRAHGVQFLPADVAPVIKRGLAGKVEVEWSGYDRLMGPVLAGPKGLPSVWLAPFRLDNPDANLYGGLASPAYADVAGQYLRAIGEHFRAKKWPRPMTWIHRDPPAQASLPYGASHWRDWLTEQHRQESLTIGRLVRATEFDMDYMDPLPWSARTAASDHPAGDGAAPAVAAAIAGRPAVLVPPHVSVYCPPAQFLEPELIPRMQSRTLATWLGEGEPPWRPAAQVFAHPEQLEALAYLARRYGLQTVWLGRSQRWPAKSPLAAAMDASDADFLFYPGQWFNQDRPVASLRLKHLRLAVQDAAYLTLVAQAGKASARAVVDGVVKYALSEAAAATPGLGGPIGWIQEPAFYADARMMLRQELQPAPAKPADDDATGQAEFRWRHFDERTAWLRLTPLPGQLLDQPGPAATGKDSSPLRAIFRVAGYMDREALKPALAAQVASPKLVMGDLPAGWKATRFNVPIEPSGAAQSLAVAADGKDLAIDPTGRVAFPLVVNDVGPADVPKLAANVPVVPAHAFRQSPRIDGRLDDWPLTWFRGGDFQRLAMGEPVSPFRQPAQTVAKTLFMAGSDNQAVYLAIACMEQKPTEISPRYGNKVQFDRGLITGEDAVELVLDPSGGKLDRQGLYHLAIKATGAVAGWRGMAGAGGLGQPEAWGRTVRAELNFQQDHWIIELAIPKNEFVQINEQGLWRLNVIRHFAARGEHSAWASSCPLLGEPESLGNLLLRPPPLPEIKVPLTTPIIEPGGGRLVP